MLTICNKRQRQRAIYGRVKSGADYNGASTVYTLLAKKLDKGHSYTT